MDSVLNAESNKTHNDDDLEQNISTHSKGETDLAITMLCIMLTIIFILGDSIVYGKLGQICA